MPLSNLAKSPFVVLTSGYRKVKNPEIEEVAKEKTGSFNGRILGHEGIGIVEEVGSAVQNFK